MPRQGGRISRGVREGILGRGPREEGQESVLFVVCTGGEDQRSSLVGILEAKDLAKALKVLASHVVSGMGEPLEVVREEGL